MDRIRSLGAKETVKDMSYKNDIQNNDEEHPKKKMTFQGKATQQKNLSTGAIFATKFC